VFIYPIFSAGNSRSFSKGYAHGRRKFLGDSLKNKTTQLNKNEFYRMATENSNKISHLEQS